MKATIFAISLILAFAAHAESGVWDTLAKGTPGEAVVTDFHQDGTQVSVDIKTRDSLGRETTTSMKVCAAAEDSATEVWRAFELDRQLEQLKAAKASGKAISATNMGPWSPCLKLSTL